MALAGFDSIRLNCFYYFLYKSTILIYHSRASDMRNNTLYNLKGGPATGRPYVICGQTNEEGARRSKHGGASYQKEGGGA